MNQTPRRSRLKLIGLVAAGFTLVALLASGAVWVGLQLVDQLGAPGIPSATGSGPCGSADAVNIQLVFADGHPVEACTRDLPACPNQNGTVIVNGQSQTTESQFVLSNQLRSSPRRYILFIRSDMAFAADMSERVLQLDPRVFLVPKGAPGPSPANDSTSAHAVIEVTPRDPTEGGYTAGAGTIRVSSTHGVVRGQIDGTFGVGSRPDRPHPTPGQMPVEVVGTFACHQ